MATKATSAEPSVWKYCRLSLHRSQISQDLEGSRSAAAAASPLRFQIRSSKQTTGFRSRLSDQGRFMLSPTGACAWPVPAECQVDKGRKEVGFSNCNSLTSRKARLTANSLYPCRYCIQRCGTPVLFFDEHQHRQKSSISTMKLMAWA